MKGAGGRHPKGLKAYTVHKAHFPKIHSQES